MVSPSPEEFRKLCQPGISIPVVGDLLADVETPVSVYWKLAHESIHSFLLESVTGGEQVARYSFIGYKPTSVIRTKGDGVTVKTPTDTKESNLSPGQDPLDILESHMPPPAAHRSGLPNLLGGAVGYLGYDIVRFFEHLPSSTKDVLEVDDLAMMMVHRVVVFDHAKNLIRVIVLAEPTEEGYQDAIRQIDEVRAKIGTPLPPLPGPGTGNFQPAKSNMSQNEFEAIVTRMKEYVEAGDGLQFVPSQRFSTPTDAHPLSIYRCLRSLNPSPFMFLFRFGDHDVIGASPELHVGLRDRTARVRPIAGTRWRGQSEEEDRALGEELLADEKERAEHIMLVDLGRNDLGRVCDYGSVHIGDLMVIERYSHVMHIVSDVTGTLSADKSATDLVRATFPAGTVSGAPKVRAMEIIEELEPHRRGLYAGAIGYFSANGDLDTAIALRTILLKNGVAHVQAGGGVVFDSDPTLEYNESCNKARAPLRAIEMAQNGELF